MSEQKHHDELQWARNAHNIISYENELELVDLIIE